MSDMDRQVITVLGMHRSGTSLCANLLHAMGVDMAEEAAPSPNNRRGHWERPRINDFNDQVFAQFGRAWSDSAHALALPPHWLDDPDVQGVRKALTDWLAPQLANGFPWGFKDPRTARLLPLWRQVFADLDVAPRFVFCVRNPAQVARSLSVRDRMESAQAEYRWLVYNAQAIMDLGADRVCVIPYEDWFARPRETAARLADWVCAPPLPPEAWATLIDPGLRHDSDSQLPARPLASRLHKLISRSAAGDGFDADLRGFCACLNEFEQQVQPLLVDVEVLRASVADQNRVIRDLHAALSRAREHA
jgi:hypothetical protein